MHQTITLMAKDPAVSSIECDCLQRADISLTESDDSSPGDHDMDQVVARRLSVQVGAPWGIDRIDTNGGAIDGSFDDGDLTGKGVRVYVVDGGVQGSHVDFGGRVVPGHTVRAASVARVQSSECPHTPPPPVTSCSTTRPSTAPHHLTTLTTPSPPSPLTPLPSPPDHPHSPSPSSPDHPPHLTTLTPLPIPTTLSPHRPPQMLHSFPVLRKRCPLETLALRPSQSLSSYFRPLS